MCEIDRGLAGKEGSLAGVGALYCARAEIFIFPLRLVAYKIAVGSSCSLGEVAQAFIYLTTLPKHERELLLMRSGKRIYP